MTTKKGLAGGSDQQVLGAGASWSYLWFPNRARFNTAYEHVPMVKITWDEASLRLIASEHPTSYWLLGNEPDYAGTVGNSLKPDEAAVAWHDTMAVIRSVAPKSKFIAGGLFWCWGTQWLDAFRDAYKARYVYYPDIAGWHVHAYADPAKYTTDSWRNNLLALKGWVDLKTPGKEIWITEFGCTVNWIFAKRVMQEQVPWLEAQTWLTRYAWYTGYVTSMQGSLFTSDSSMQMTELGMIYKSLGIPVIPPWTPPAFVNGLRRYNDPAIPVGCPGVMEFGRDGVADRRYACQLPTGHGNCHFCDDGSVKAEWIP